ncbi:MAG: ADOP family duplicated permease [Gemmatimonadales bacterium]
MRVRLNQQRLIEVLSQSALTQNHWAIKLGLSRGHLSDLANGKHPYPSPVTRQKLLDGLRLSFEDLFIVETGSTEWTHASSASFQAAVVDRYLIDEEVGQGGMGTVYLARDVKHGRQVAIKVISPEAVSGVGADQFLKEIRNTARLEHPHILTLFDSGQAAGYPYYVMPYIRGGSLRDLLKKKQRLSVDETVQIAKGIAAALRHAHDHRVVHCDVKPENILLGPEGHAYLADFGIARAVHAEVRAWRRAGEIDSSAGTPAYVSPEQAIGEPNLDGRTDVYSFGCVVYEMLAGKPPFEGTTTMETVTKRFTGPVPDLKESGVHIPSGIAAAVRKAMAIDADRRLQTAGQFFHALREASATHQSAFLEAVSLGASRTLGRVGRWLAPLMRNAAVGTITQDLTYSLRSLKRRPAQTAVLIATLALGIGINSAMFSVVSTVLLRPLPYPAPEQLVQLWESRRDAPREIAVAYPNFVDIRDQAEQFAHVAAYLGGDTPVSGGETPVRVRVYAVSEAFFDVLGVTPQMGGTLVSETNTPFGPVNVVIGDGFWRSYFGADPSVLGSVVSISGTPATVVGVMPPGFAFPRGAQLWIPRDLSPIFGPSRTAHNLSAIARLAGDASVSRAQAEMSGLAVRLASSYAGEIDENFDIAVVSLHQELTGGTRSTLVLLLVVVGVVLLIACGNIASILLSQAAARNKEMAIRRAVGAGSARLVRQMLTESGLIGVIGAAAGLALSFWSLSFLNTLVPPRYLHSGQITLGWRVVTFTLLLGVVTGILFGVLPAWRSTNLQPADALRTDGANVVAGSRHRRIGGWFVIPQYAFSLSALVVAGLILKSLFALTRVDPGFEVQGLITVDLSLPFSPPSPYGDRANGARFHRALMAQAGALPGVRSVTLDYAPPLSGAFVINGGVQRGDESRDDRWDQYTDWRPVGPEYFRTVGIPILQGRDFDERDAEDAPPVVIVNQRLARTLWGDDDPLGKRLRLSSLDNNREEALRLLTVVGVVPDVHHRSLAGAPRSAAYAPVFQHLDCIRPVDLVMSVTGPLENYAGLLRDIIRTIDPEIPVGRVETMEGWAKESIAAPRFRAGLLTAFGGLALLLALLGVYGVMSYSVTQRRREMAVRLALGAQRRDIMGLLTGEGLRFVIAGQVLGVVGALALTRLVEGLLFGVSSRDLTVFALASVALASIVMLASYIPARRAGRVQPVEVLKE